MNDPTLQRGCERLAEVLAGPRHPDHPYVLSGYTHGQVYAMAAWLVEHFRTSDGGRQLVCLAAEDRGIIAAALLAALAGGPILLLPYGFSERILAGIHGSTGYRSAIVDRDLPWPPGVGTVHPQPETNRPLVADPAPTADRVLLHLYTGGSTGVPQFWSKTAGNLLFETMHLVDFLAVSAADRIVATVSPYHIYGLLYSVLLPLLASAAVSPLAPSYPAEIVAAVADEQATVLVSVPAHYDTLYGRTCATGRLRLATSSAGMLSEESNREFRQRNRLELIEIYGSTETGGIASRSRFRAEEHFRLFPAVEARLVGERLAIRSPFTSPEAPRDGDGFFLCGDRAVFPEPGLLAPQGRADHIAKVGGKRVNLEEVRTAVRQQAGVSDAVVLTVPVGGGREQQVVAVAQGRCTPESIRAGLAGLLEPYAMPRIIRCVSAIPVTVNGKYDRDAILALVKP